MSAPVRWRKNPRNVHTIRAVATTLSCKVCPGSKIVSRRSHRRWPLVLQKLLMLNKLLAASQPELLNLKLFQPPPQAAPARQALGIYLDIVMVPQPLGPSGPTSRGLRMTTRNTRRRLDTFSSPEDEHARIAVLLRFPLEQFHAGVSTWFEKFWATTNASFSKLARIHGKTCVLSARLVFETRAKFQDSVARCKDDGIPYAVDGPFCNTNTKITVRQSKSLEDREFGRRFAPLCENSMKHSQNEMLKTFIVPALDAR